MTLPDRLKQYGDDLIECEKCGKEVKIKEANAYHEPDGQDDFITVYYCDKCYHWKEV